MSKELLLIGAALLALTLLLDGTRMAWRINAALVAATLPQNVLGVRRFWYTEAWRELLVAGQKSADVHAMDPATKRPPHKCYY